MIPTYFKPYHNNLSNLIRLGRKSDGGYVIDKRVINKTNAIITCGLEAEWSFEKQFQKYIKNCKILAFDHTVNKKFWAENPSVYWETKFIIIVGVKNCYTPNAESIVSNS